MVDDAHDEEERTLEQGVGQQERERRECRVSRAIARDDREEAQLTDGPVGEEELEVSLLESYVAAEQHGRDAEPDQYFTPPRHVEEGGREAGDQVDARLDHRRGVQVGAHGGRRGHRAGQPEVHRDDRGLREGADEHEEDRRGREGTRGRGGEDHVEGGRSRLHREQHEAHEHDEPAEGCRDESLEGGTAARPPTRVVADEQVREDARGLPEDEQQVDVVGGDEAVHRSREGEQHGGEAPEARLVVGEVPGAVDEHEAADARDDEREHPRERVHAEVEGELQLRDPREALDRVRLRVAVEDRGSLQQGVHEGAERDEPGQEEHPTAEDAHEGREDDRGHAEHR